MDQFILEVIGTVIGAENNLHLPLGVAQLRLNCDGSVTREIGVLVLQQGPQNILNRVGITT